MNDTTFRTTPPRRSAGARLAADVRLAWRQALRTPRATALVAGLIAIGTAVVTWSVTETNSRWSEPETGIDPGVAAWNIAPMVLVSAFATVLLAGSAMMVSTRQQRRMHAIASAVGADRACLIRVVILQGALLGLIGGVVGIGLGIGVTAILLAVRVDGDGTRSVLSVPWAQLAWVLVFALAVSVVAAAVPARAAAGASPLEALRDRRAPVSPVRRRPAVALILAVAGVAITAGSLILFSLPMGENGPLWFSLIGTVVGPIVVVIGFLVGSPWVLTGISRLLGRLDTAARLAGRDAAANPRRVAPAIAVIAASAFVATALGSFGVMIVRPFEVSYQWTAARDSVVVTIDSTDPDLEEAARGLVAPTGPERIVTVETAAVSMLAADEDPDFPVFAVSTNTAACATCFEAYADAPTIVSAEDVDALFDVELPASARDVLRDGGMLIPVLPGTELGVSQAEIVETTLEHYAAPDAHIVRTTRVPAVEVPAPSFYTAVITPETAAAAGIRTQPKSVIATYAEPLPDGVAAGLQSQSDDDGRFQVVEETGPTETAASAAAVIFIPAILLALAASAIALGLSRYERRRDDATLAAVGANPGLLRRIGAWEALIVTGTGAVMGVIAGVALMGGFALLGEVQNVWALPWPWAWILAIAIGLPAVMTAAAWILPPRLPEPTHRTAIA